MILRSFASGSLAATVLATRPTPGGLVEEQGRKWPEKGDFAGSGSIAIGSIGRNKGAALENPAKGSPFANPGVQRRTAQGQAVRGVAGLFADVAVG